MKEPLTRITAFALVIFSCCVFAEEPPPPPALELPNLEDTKPRVLCVDCDAPFDTTTHTRILKDLVANPHIKQLRLALYKQDILHQFESKAHFDNCDFASSIHYIVELFDETGQHVQRALAGQDSGNSSIASSALSDAFFTLGQALHGVQDFYAHSNYIEITAPTVEKITDISLVHTWREEGVKTVQALQDKGLVSGVVWWGIPKLCPEGTKNHADLAKDSNETKSGKKRITHLQNYSQYQIAEFLARESSLALMSDAYKKWPILRETSGDYIAFEAIVDRRKMSH